MSLAAFQFTDRARPVVEIGIGDARVQVGTGRWDISRFDEPTATWAGDEPAWLEMTCETISADCSYGRAAVTDRFVAGTATVVVDNTTGWADPTAVVTPGTLTMRPGRAIRFGVWHEDYGTRWLFRGFVDVVTPHYDPTLTDVVELACIDALGEVNRGKLPALEAPSYAGESAEVRVARILDRAEWPSTKRAIQRSGVTLTASDLGGQVADLLGVVADSSAGAIFGDLDGNVAYRARDWQAFTPGTPVDGTIGNVDMNGTPPVPPSITAPGYLTPTIGTVSTPDTGWSGAVPWEMTFRLRSNVALPAASDRWIAGQWAGSASVQKWFLGARSTGLIFGIYNDAGVRLDYTIGTTAQMTALFTPGVDVWLRVWLTATAATGYASTDGVNWSVLRTHAATYSGPRVSTSELAIGVHAGTTNRWDGRIYSAVASSLNGAGNPTATLWRFDADDYPGTGTVYTDPRGRVWTLSAAGAITPKIVDPGHPGVAPDVCPTGWVRPFDRADITTRVILGRATEQPWQHLQTDDEDGQALYGIEPFERTYLLTESDYYMTQLGSRILATRGAQTAPRVRSVNLDARTSDAALDLMSTVDVYKPSRYRCRLQYPPPHGLVFDGEYFATGVHHSLSPSVWSLELNLDVAAPLPATDPSTWDWATWDNAPWK